jgi:hypothetical protein
MIETAQEARHGSVLFEGDRLPLEGMSVFEAKAMLNDAWGIPYFADAIVNGRLVPVAHVLQPGDRLKFSQRFGVKAGNDKPITEAIGEAVVIAYPKLLEIEARVKACNLSTDESLRLMTSMIGRWMEEQFGPPGPSVMPVLADIVKRLQAIETVLGQRFASPASDLDNLTDTEEIILETLRGKSRKAASIATAGKLKHNSNLKSTLSSLVKRGILGKGPDGYFRNAPPKSGPGQD